jgi:hypothetical protein
MGNSKKMYVLLEEKGPIFRIKTILEALDYNVSGKTMIMDDLININPTPCAIYYNDSEDQGYFLILEQIQKKEECYEFLLKHSEDGHMILTEQKFSEVWSYIRYNKEYKGFLFILKKELIKNLFV